MARVLSRMKSLPADLVIKLNFKGILTCEDFLTRNPLELMDILDIAYPQLQDLICCVSNTCAPPGKTVLALSHGRSARFLPTSIAELDSILKGGLPPSTITEISGPPGCGKTQFCILLSALSALPVAMSGRGSPVIYIDTEGAFSAERLIEMARHHHHRVPSASSSTNTDHFPTTHIHDDPEPENIESYLLELASNVHVYKELTCGDFLECLERLDVIIASKGAGLVIVDSIASLVRKEYDMSTKKGVVGRTNALMKQSSRLKYLAESFDIQIVVTNQIVTQFSLERQCEDNNEVDCDGGVVTPALGNAWYHSINTRLLLDYKDGQQRELTVIKSPLCSRNSITVAIERVGFTVPSLDTDELKQDELLERTGFNTASHRGFPLEFPGQ